MNKAILKFFIIGLLITLFSPYLVKADGCFVSKLEDYVLPSDQKAVIFFMKMVERH